jgi:hypothetical protein
MHRQAGSKITDYTNEIKKVATLGSVRRMLGSCRLKNFGRFIPNSKGPEMCKISLIIISLRREFDPFGRTT